MSFDHSSTKTTAPEIPNLPISEAICLIPRLIRYRAEAMREIAHHGEGLIRVRLPGKSFYLASRPEFVRQILQTRGSGYKRSFDNEVLKDLLGDGVLTAHGESWSMARTGLAPSLKSEAVKRFRPQLEALLSEKLINLGNDPIRAFKFSSRLMLELTLSVLYGIHGDLELVDRLLSNIAICLSELDRRLASVVDVAKWT